MKNTEECIKYLVKALEVKPSSLSTWNNIYFQLCIMQYVKQNDKKFLSYYFKNKKLHTIYYSLLEYMLNIGQENSKYFFNKSD